MTDIASPLFPLGCTLAAPGALDALARPGNDPGTGFGSYLTRHVTGDWGELDSEAHAANDWAVVFGDERVLSHYRLPDQTSIWVIPRPTGQPQPSYCPSSTSLGGALADVFPRVGQPQPH
jgi:hypothetical protein